jgi:mRNA interferase RelE/StbE
MASYKVTFKASVAKDLRRLDRLAAHRVLRAVESLGKNPFPTSSKKLIGSGHTFRIRVGDYRVIYIVNKQGREVEIQKVRHRRDVYL